MTDDPHPMAERIASSIQDRIDEGHSTRRRFLGSSALAGLVTVGAPGVVLADEHEDDEEGQTAMFDDVEGTDVDVLNYALSLEHLEDVFYREALEQFDETAFVEAEALQSFDEDFRRGVFGYVQTVAEHEATHVDVLTQVVTLLGGTPAPEGTYEFGVETVGDFLALGQVFENTGVAAYAGAAPFIDSPDLLSAALSIHSTEARHAAVLNQVNAASPFPDAFDAAASQQDVLDAVSSFIVTGDGENGDGTGGTGGEDGDGTGGTGGDDSEETGGDDGTGGTGGGSEEGDDENSARTGPPGGRDDEDTTSRGPDDDEEDDD